MKTFLIASLMLAAASVHSTTYYVDSEKGNDTNPGTSPTAPWKSISHVNSRKFVPGDTILFKRGSLFRGKLNTCSGTQGKPVTYAAYGEGPKPIIQPSLDHNAPKYWSEVSPDIWVTSSDFKPKSIRELQDLRSSKWHLYHEKGTDVSCSVSLQGEQRTYDIHCRQQGQKITNIQFIGPLVKDEAEHFVFTFRIRSTIPFKLPQFRLMLTRKPFSTYNLAAEKQQTVTTEWQEMSVLLIRQSYGPQSKFNCFMGTAIPNGATVQFQPLSLSAAQTNSHGPLLADIGNIIFNHGQYIGWKRWSVQELKNERDYFHDLNEGIVYMKHKGNPGAGAYSSMELAPRCHIISHSNKHDVVVDGLHVRYTGGHGFAGGTTQRITIRNCDISYIGGSLLYTRNNRPTRYGNGVEFWSDSQDCLIENNRFWQIYDVAMTNQGNAPNTVQKNLIFKNNFVFDCEQAYEYWRSPDNAVTDNIQFIGNTCINAGKGWSHAQRPNKNACHLLGYGVTAKTSNMVIKDNVLYNAVNSILLYYDNWFYALDIDHNLWYQDMGDKLIVVNKTGHRFAPNEWEKYRQVFKKDAKSIYAKPIFRNPNFDNPLEGDFRLAPDSPGANAASDGGPIGIR